MPGIIWLVVVVPRALLHRAGHRRRPAQQPSSSRRSPSGIRSTGPEPTSPPSSTTWSARGRSSGPSSLARSSTWPSPRCCPSLIAYPAAYFVTRFAGRRKVLFLALLIAPFWISYMMRMLAWIDLLQTDGYVNRALVDLHLVSQPVNWLGGKPVDRHPRTGLRLHPLPDPGPLRRARPHRPTVDRSRARPRPQPDPDLPPGHPPVESAGHPDRHVDHRAADDRRLLHQSAAVRAHRRPP